MLTTLYVFTSYTSRLLQRRDAIYDSLPLWVHCFAFNIIPPPLRCCGGMWRTAAPAAEGVLPVRKTARHKLATFFCATGIRVSRRARDHGDGRAVAGARGGYDAAMTEPPPEP